MKKSLFQKSIILLFALPALACALTGGEEPTATPTTAPVATTEVIATVPATEVPPTPTLEVVVEPTVDLTADFISHTSPETGITVQHPSDWAIQDFFILLIATDETIFDAPGAISEGAGVVFAAGPAEDFESTNPIDLANEAVVQFELSDDVTIVEGPTELTINGQPAAIAKIEGTPDQTGILMSGIAVVVINDDRVVVGLGMTPKETEEEYIPTIEAMFNTIEVGEAVEEPEVTNTEGPTMDGSTMLSVGDIFASPLNEDGQRDFFFNGQAGETVTFTIEPQDDAMDLVMEIFDADLNSLVRQDNEFSGDPEVVIFTPLADGTYFIRVSDFYGATGSFNVTAVAGAVESTEPISETISLETGQLTEGALTGAPRYYAFTGTAGQPTTILLLPTEDLDATIAILGSDGTILVDEIDEGFSGDPEAVTFTPDADGEYLLLVDAFSTPQGDFNLFIFDSENSLKVEGTVPDNSFQNYRVCVPANATLIVAVLPVGSLDPVINLNGPGGGQLINPIDGGGIGDPEAIMFSDGADSGTEYPVIISIESYDGVSGDFELFVSSTSTENVVLDGC